MQRRDLSFTLTEDHVKLLRQFRVCWDEGEFGAPCINPKRPYGNSDVPEDIHEILTGTHRGTLTEEQVQRYTALHAELEYALAIVLRTGAFEPGAYVRDEYQQNWRKA